MAWRESTDPRWAPVSWQQGRSAGAPSGTSNAATMRSPIDTPRVPQSTTEHKKMTPLQILAARAVRHLAGLLLALGGCATRPANPPIAQADPDAATASRRGWQTRKEGKPGHPGLLGRRHPRGRLFLRRARVPAPYRGGRPEGQDRAPARFGRRHHRCVGRQLHRAGLRPVRRQAVRRLRAALPEARCAGRDRRARLQPVQLGHAGGAESTGPVRDCRRSCTTRSCSMAPPSAICAVARGR